MESLIPNLQELLILPKVILERVDVLPEYIIQAIIESLYFVPVLYILYLIIEIIERIFMKRIGFLVKLIKKFGPFFGVSISTLPECGFQVIAATYYSRKIITRGTLMSFFITCSDDAYPILFMDLDKTNILIPLIIIKIILGLLVWMAVDSMIIFMKKPTEEVNAVNIELNEDACCHHKLSSLREAEVGWGHPWAHTLNMFFFVAIALSVYYSAVNSLGSGGNVARLLMYNTPIQITGCAAFGLIPSCAASVFLTIAYLKGAVSFAAYLAGLISTTGVGLLTLAKLSKRNTDTFFIAFILFITALLTGLAMSVFPVPSIPIFAE